MAISMKRLVSGRRSQGGAVQSVDYRIVGDGHRDAGEWAAAAVAYCRYLEANPRDTAIWIQAGNCHKEAGNFAKSLVAYRKAEQLEPNSSEVQLQLGHLYKVTGNLGAALAAYERAAAFDPHVSGVKHEIQDIAERLRTSGFQTPTVLNLFGSVEDLLEGFRGLPRDQDPFVAYFKSIGGELADQTR